MRIQPIVEGYGEVEAVPILLRRLRDEAEAWELEINPPIRRKRSEFLDESALRKSVRLALLQPDCRAILILFDSDDDCPKEKAPEIENWARDEAGETPCAVVMAHREFEAWFLATVESLRGRRGIRNDAEPPAEPESPRDAKGRLERRMEQGRSYSETSDQAPLTAVFDFPTAYGRSRSFRRMVRAFGALVAGTGITLSEWPPASWESA